MLHRLIVPADCAIVAGVEGAESYKQVFFDFEEIEGGGMYGTAIDGIRKSVLVAALDEVGRA